MASVQLKQLRDEALGLPAEDRAQLAHDLLASLDGPADSDADSAWATEIERRVAELDAGTVTTVDADEVLRQARGRLRSTR